jgi:hypothetical protein
MRVARAAPARRHPIATPATAPPDSPFLVITDDVGEAVLKFDPSLATVNVLDKTGVLSGVTEEAVTPAALVAVTSKPGRPTGAGVDDITALVDVFVFTPVLS